MSFNRHNSAAARCMREAVAHLCERFARSSPPISASCCLGCADRRSGTSGRAGVRNKVTISAGSRPVNRKMDILTRGQAVGWPW